jgi:hypothetical protein
LHEAAVVLGVLCLKGFKMAFKIPVEGAQEGPDLFLESVGQAPHSGCCENLERHEMGLPVPDLSQPREIPADHGIDFGILQTELAEPVTHNKGCG